jgi:hypothetical protein
MADAVGPVYRGQQITLSAVACVMTLLGSVAICLRIAGRYLVVRQLGTDDWLMVAGMVWHLQNSERNLEKLIS